jgi:hypothetical protein
VNIAIAHAAFLPERARTLDRLLTQLGAPVAVLRSERREHASVWARRLWEFAGDDAIVCLNDDVEVCPDFRDVVESMVRAVPDQVIALHTTSPAAPSLVAAGERWLRSYWLTGPGYILPASAARRLLAWIDASPRQLAASVNEDNLIMHWAWHEQRPIWHCLPALVKHDTGVPSSLGYDLHPGRVTNVPWSNHPIPADWTPAQKPVLVECPWMTRERLRETEMALTAEPQVCCFCFGAMGVAASPTGACVCAQCIVKIVAALAGKAMAK